MYILWFVKPIFGLREGEKEKTTVRTVEDTGPNA